MDTRILEFINLGILLICLYIIKGIIEKNTSKKKSIGAILFLNSDTIAKGMRITLLGVTLWAIKEGLEVIEVFTPGRTTEIYTILGIITSLILSYGLYLLIWAFRKKGRL